MSPEISRQFRTLEQLMGTQEPLQRISFLGSDISVVAAHDPPSFDLVAPTLEDVIVTGPSTVVNGSTVPDGLFREIQRATINHNEGANILNIEIRMVRDSDSAFINLVSTFASLPDPITQNVFGQSKSLIPPGWHMQVTFPALTAGKIGRLKTVFIDRALGLSPNLV